MEKRKIKRVEYSENFLKSLRKLPERIINQAKTKEGTFRKNLFDSRLKTHKLHGKEKDAWAFWINYNYRIKFIFLNDEEVLFLDIGSHDIYK